MAAPSQKDGGMRRVARAAANLATMRAVARVRAAQPAASVRVLPVCHVHNAAALAC